MGGNGSYDKVLGGVVEGKRTHYDTGYRIDGHKVVTQTSQFLNYLTHCFI